MSDNQQQPKMWPIDLDRAAQEIAGTATRAVRQLLPFPGGDIAALPLMSPARTITARASNPSASAGTAAADIVSQAAAILDQEMANGLIAAQQAPAAAPWRMAGAPAMAPTTVGLPGADILQQVRDVIDNVARIWPTSGTDGAFTPAASIPTAASRAPSVVELKPPAPVRPGDQTTITMTIRNREDGPVSLAPAATPLLGSNGERIPVQLLDLGPTEMRLDPGQQQELRVTITIPARCASGCYSGLLVIGGVDYLRALITIDVRP